ncbi:MaoC family dehydratase N-terminal domain-containing protein [Rhodococcus sp. CX]|uniref:FAS1-like dehydratase domain-containing protein n=1 Tax=Rhodococcus sp. CX TaxID=2789880 RepID=UPI0018CD34CD|nr:MaoC family dehydratase N-terminal domain-containing protein [Rhodococcus sp. CX]MBH0118406.1 MaoC family dehydratase N-terminal domain-containing protein [Rhodococcus sp. CX]
MVKFPVEWGKVREYARATGAARPAYLDDPMSPIPPTFLATVVYWVEIGDTVRSPEVADACATAGVPFDITSLLSLEQEYVFHGPPPRAGDTLYVSERLHDVRIKQGRSGPMVIVRFVVSFAGDDDKVRAECWYTSAYVLKEKP